MEKSTQETEHPDQPAPKSSSKDIPAVGQSQETEHLDQPALACGPLDDIPAIGQPQLWTRRRIITLALSLSAGLVASFWPRLLKRFGPDAKPRPAPLRVRPRFLLTKTPPLFAEMRLSEGFYARPPRPVTQRLSKSKGAKTSVIHYADARKRIPFIAAINEKRLQPAKPDELALKSANAHVYFARASASFELAALERVGNKQYQEASQMLIDGIRHDLVFKTSNGGGPSLRLFDLLAIVVIRRELNDYSDMLLNLAEEARPLIKYQSVGAPVPRKRRGGKSKMPEPAGSEELEKFRQIRQEAFEARLRKWKDKDSAWYKRVKNTEKELAWSMTMVPDAPRVLL